MAGTPISFDSNNLQTFDGSHGIIIQEIDHHGTPDKNSPMFPFAHYSAMAIPFTSYPSKSIGVRGEIVGNSLSDLDLIIDTFKGYLIGEQKNLDIGYASGTRRYIASTQATPVPRPNGLLSANFEIPFLCQPFGTDINATTALSVTGRTNSGYTDSFIFTGNTPGQSPVFTVTYTALTSSGSSSVMLGNPNTGQQITVMRTWSAGDVLVVDVPNKSVRVNSIETAFTGGWPMFAKGLQNITYSDTHTTRTFDELVKYNALWM